MFEITNLAIWLSAMTSAATSTIATTILKPFRAVKLFQLVWRFYGNLELV